MNVHTAKLILTWGSLIAAIVAAAWWLKASVTEVRKGDPRFRIGLVFQDIDLISTSREQTKWNKWAAVATAISVLMQAIGSLLP